MLPTIELGIIVFTSLEGRAPSVSGEEAITKWPGATSLRFSGLPAVGGVRFFPDFIVITETALRRARFLPPGAPHAALNRGGQTGRLHRLLLKRCPVADPFSRAKLGNMEVTLHIPDDIAKRLSAAGGDISRRALESVALEGYRDQTLTLYQISQMLGLSRVETEDFLGQHHVPLALIDETDLDREAALFEAASRRNPR